MDEVLVVVVAAMISGNLIGLSLIALRVCVLLLLLLILLPGHCCIVHTSQHRSDKRQWITGCILASSTNQLLMHMTMVTALL